MADYKESQIMGSEYTRCSQVVISNPLASTPQVQFYEERVAVIGERSLITPDGHVQIAFDAEKVIPLVNPETLNPIPGQSTTMGHLYLALFSAYIQTALERDAEAQQPPVGPS